MKRSLTIASFLLIAALSFLFPACKGKDNTLAPPPPGPAWVTFQRPAIPGLVNNQINSLSIGADGGVWISTDSGASIFNDGAWSFIKDSLKYTTFSTGGSTLSAKVNGVAPGADGSIWFGLSGGGVKRYHPGSAFYVWQTYNVPDVAFGTISGISSDAQVYGDIWVATPAAGISRYIPHLTLPDEGTWVTYTTSTTAQILTNQIRTTAHDDYTNTVWFGTFMGAISYNESEGWSNVVLPVDQSGVIVSIAFDNANNIWMAKSSGTSPGVTKYNKTSGDFASYTEANTGGMIPVDGVNVLTTNYRTTRWFGTNSGLVGLDDTTWTHFSSANTAEIPNDTITALVIDRKSNLWIGTRNGIAVYNPEGTRF